MAGFYQQLLKGTKSSRPGASTGPNLRDYTHASKTFLSDGFANAPRYKYLFHVYFEINSSQVSAAGGQEFPDDRLPGLLVKNINLPKYTMNLTEMNQYNRKRYVQTKISYDPVTVVFHDDNRGSIRKVWYNYFQYYYNDTTTATNSRGALNLKDVYLDNLDAKNWGYNGEDTPNNSAQQNKPGFFKSIKIFGFNQHDFSLYTLVNPVIDRWEHDNYDYYQSNGVMENRMTVRYETVTYSNGNLDGVDPDTIVNGFGTRSYYDNRESPITLKNTNSTVMGKDGIVNSQGGSIASESNDAQRAANRARDTQLLASQNSKRPGQRLTAANNKILNGARGVSNTSANNRGQFNVPAPGANPGGSPDMRASGENIQYTQAPIIIDTGL